MVDCSIADELTWSEDLSNLLAVTLIHEMTHTRGAGQLNDVKGAWDSAGTRWIPAYGWTLIKELAKKKPYVDTGSPRAPDNNADSVALFALGMQYALLFGNLVLICNDDRMLAHEQTTSTVRDHRRWGRRNHS